MADVFDVATTNPGVGGTNLCGDSFPQGGIQKFLPASYLVYGPQEGPYTRVDTLTGLPVGIVGVVPVSGPLTDTELRATPVPVSGSFWQATQPVSGPLTDTELRATPVPVSGSFWQATQPVSGPLTDTQLRASAVPVSVGIPADVTLLASASRSADSSSNDVVNSGYRGVYLFLNVTAVAGGGQTISVYLQAKDPISGNYVYISSAPVAVSATGLFGLEFYPGVSGGTNVAIGYTLNRFAIHLPRTWRAYVVHSGGGAFTYSLAASCLV